MAASSYISNFNRSFPYKLLLFIIGLVILDYAIGAGLMFFVSHSSTGKYGGKVNHIMQNDFDILVYGSSRACDHYIPSILSEETNMTSYNAGERGALIHYIYALHELIIANDTPEVIILDYDPSLLTGSDPFTRMDRLLPFYKESVIKKHFSKFDKYARLKNILHCNAFSGKFIQVILFYLLPDIQSNQDGYLPLYGNHSTVTKPQMTSGKIVDYNPKSVSAFISFMDSCRENDIELILIASPRYSYGKFNMPEIVTNYIKTNSIPYIDFNFTDFPELNEIKFFHDAIHLNHEGSQVFSRYVNQILKIAKVNTTLAIFIFDPNFLFLILIIFILFQKTR